MTLFLAFCVFGSAEHTAFPHCTHFLHHFDRGYLNTLSSYYELSFSLAQCNGTLDERPPWMRDYLSHKIVLKFFASFFLADEHFHLIFRVVFKEGLYYPMPG